MPNAPRFPFLRVIAALMIRETITRYGRSWGGYIWAVLEPVGMVAILALAFSQFIETPPLGQSFVLFYATGYVPFHVYNEIAINTGSSVTVNRPLMEFPMVTPLDTVIARFLLSFLTLVIVTFAVFAGISLIMTDPMRIDPAPLLSALAAGGMLGIGVGTLNAVLFTFFPVWQRIWQIVNRPLFIISGVFFTFDSMPDHIQALLWWNPLIHVIGEARTAFYPTYNGDYVTLSYAFAIGVGTFLLGAALMMRHRSYVVEND